jgi:DNA segregation ATPase FtsK/SpoIIIE, S-DNA-T family
MAKKTTEDPRPQKLRGIFLLFLSLYLCIAFTSYLFTWETDSDLVNRFSLDLLVSDKQMENWLGRLGAIVSNLFFYWLFGLPSFVIVYLLFLYGIGIVNDVPTERYAKRFRNSILWMVAGSILLGFVSSLWGAQFPWGGTFGLGISSWLAGFVGKFGVAVLAIFAFIGLVIWTFNPDIAGFNKSKAEDFIYNIWDGRYRTGDAKFQAAQAARTAEDVAMDKVAAEKPKSKDKPPALTPKNEKVPAISLAPIKANEKGFMEDALGETEISTTIPKEKTEKNPKIVLEKAPAEGEKPPAEGELQLSNTPKEKPASLKSGEGTALEIAVPSANVSVEVEMPAAKVSKPKLPQTLFTGMTDEEYGKIGTPYDSTADLPAYERPVLTLLDNYDDAKIEVDRAELEYNKDQIIETLLNYKIEITKIRATVGPTVTLYEIIPAAGVRISRIKNLEDDIALSLSALGIRIIAPMPGKGTVGIEVPNKKKQIVSLREVLMSDKFRKSDADLPIALGKTIQDEVFVVDLAKMPHLLIAGATGQGKSVGINTILMSLLYKKHPSQLKLVLIDPKKVELSPYAKIENHYLAYLPDQMEPIITDTAKVVNTLNSLCIEMDNRYDLLKKAQARNIKEYNEKFVSRRLNPEKGHAYLPFIVLVIDEFADLIMTAGKEIELPIGRLAQLARAVGIHLIIATQRPSVNIITGVIKANFPARLAFKVTSKIDSRTILDSGGADQLIGRGDMLLSAGSDVVRLQCAFVDTPEVERVIDFIDQQQGYPKPFFLPEFKGEETEHGPASLALDDLDDMLDDAARLVVQNQHGSTSMIQRRLKLGYNRAGRIMDQLEALGIVGPNEGSKPREVLYHSDPELEAFLKNLKKKRNA